MQAARPGHHLVVCRGVARAARGHKLALLSYLTDLVQVAGPVAEPAAVAGQLVLLVDGAISAAAIMGDPAAVRQARTAAASLLSAAGAARREP